jgi:hypothetical protein
MSAHRSREIDLVVHLKELVRKRKELDEEIVRAHERLAREVRETGVAYLAAA